MKLDKSNGAQLAAVLEYIQLPNHPMHAESKRMADEFVSDHRKQMLERRRIGMQNEIDEMDADGLSDFRSQTN